MPASTKMPFHKYMYRFSLPTSDPHNSVTLAEVFGVKAAKNFYKSLSPAVASKAQLTVYKVYNQVPENIGTFLEGLNPTSTLPENENQEVVTEE